MRYLRTTTLSRRSFIAATAAGITATPAIGMPLTTASSPLGPFFPVSYKGETDADLTRVAGHSERASGQVIEVNGRVLDRFGKPVSGASLKLWQCNAAGRYDHPQDPAVMPLDPNFQGFADLVTGTDGSWKLTTIKPGSYDSPIGRRTPHIHFDVAGRHARTILQMYFPDDAKENAADALYKELGADAPTSVAQALGDHRYGWDIVLIEG